MHRNLFDKRNLGRVKVLRGFVRLLSHDNSMVWTLTTEIKIIQQLMGHSDMKTTQIYAKLVDEYKHIILLNA